MSRLPTPTGPHNDGPMASSPPPDTSTPWWSDWRYALALVLACAVPLLGPKLPPFTDLLGHLARYHVELNIDSSPYLKRYFGFQWQLLGNLGVDLLVIPLSKIMPLQLAVKLITLAIPPMTAAGLLWIAREAHGRIPPTAAFALPLAYGYPFQFGFINSSLSMALCFLAFGLWLYLARKGRFGLRAILFVPIGSLIWLCHSYGWGVLGLLVFSAELVRDRGHGGSRFHAIWRAGLSTFPLWPPIILMLAWRSGAVSGSTGDWFNWVAKYAYVIAVLRERWMGFDVGSLILLLMLLLAGITRLRLKFERMLGIAAIILAITYVLLPRVLLGSAYADMRLVPFALAIAIIALRPIDLSNRALANGLAIAGCLFVVTRMGASTWSLWQFDKAYDVQLKAIDHIDRGSRVLVLVNLFCEGQWTKTRMDHLGSQVIVRRDAFANGQWTMPGAQLLTVTYKEAGRFARDPTQLLRPRTCRRRGEPILEDTLRYFPRRAFDYLWLIDMPSERWPNQPDLIPIWHTERGVLYRVDAEKQVDPPEVIPPLDPPRRRRVAPNRN